MSRLAVKHFCASRVLADLDQPMPCLIYEHRPKQTEYGENLAVIAIVIPDTDEQQKTLTVGPKLRQVVHGVRLDIYWESADAEQGGVTFDALLEVIDERFRHAMDDTKLLPIKDPETGAPSTIVFVATSIRTTVEEPVIVQQEGASTLTEGLVAYEAHKLIAVTEYLQG